ncbi:unnamed protein product [Paramecium sonneborni]|uniref:Cache domain-containing protein n=1 Tax=Paramecium sonneborni TaxID=65129 RepID=A0A8S1PDD9_9CILI|nr:unnamed protein product [Paramecium sonneborni]
MIGKNCLIKKFKTWRIRTQILVTQLITMIVSVTILGMCLFLYFEGMFSALQNEAEKKFMMNFIYRQTNSQLNAYTRNLEYRIRQGISAISHINLLNQQIYLTNMSFVQNSERCLQDWYQNGSFVLKCQYCYGIFDCSNEIKNPEQYRKELLQLSNLLTSLIPIQIGLDMYFTSITKECYFSTYPGQAFGNYKPSQRPWFQNHIAKRNESEYIISEPYANYFGGVYISGTTNLYDGKNKEKIGIIGIDLNFSDIHQLMQDDQQMLAIDKKGRILLSKFYTINTSEVYYLSNKSIFGFDQSDVNLILNQYIQQTNQKCEIQIPQTICIENKNTGILWYFRAMRMTGDYYTLSMFNQQAYSNYFQTFSSTLSTIYTEIITHFLFGLFTIIISCFFIYFGCFLMLQKPIDKMINCFNRYLLNGKQISYLMLQINQFDQLDKLSQAFIRLMTRSMSNKDNRKRIIDQHMSESKYPINYYVNSKIMNTDTKLLLKNSEMNTQRNQMIDKFFQLYRLENLQQKSF